MINNCQYLLTLSYNRLLLGRSLRFWLASAALCLAVFYQSATAQSAKIAALSNQAVSDASKYQSAAIPFLVAIVLLSLISFVGYSIVQLLKSD